LALKQRQLARRVIGVARRSETIPQAIELGAIDEGGLDPLAAVSEADLVILATPVLQMAGLLRAIAPALPAGCIISDAGSSKADITSVADSLGLGEFVGGHPMAGSEKKGVDYARADLFVGATYFLTPTVHTDGDAVSRVAQLVQGLGALPVVLSPERHDRIVAVTSHLPHLLAASLMKLILNETTRDPLTGKGMATGLRDVTRTTSGDVEMWRDVYVSNRGRLLEALESFGAVCAEVRALLEKGEASAIAEWLAGAKRFREEVYGSQPSASGPPEGQQDRPRRTSR